MYELILSFKNQIIENSLTILCRRNYRSFSVISNLRFLKTIESCSPDSIVLTDSQELLDVCSENKILCFAVEYNEPLHTKYTLLFDYELDFDYIDSIYHYVTNKKRLIFNNNDFSLYTYTKEEYVSDCIESCTEP